jgi:hypothetical protein
MIRVDGRLISIGILTALSFVVEIEDCTRHLAPEIPGNQMAVVMNDVSRLAATRKLKRYDHAREKAPALYSQTRCLPDEGCTA